MEGQCDMAAAVAGKNKLYNFVNREKENMVSNEVSVESGFKIAVKHPKAGARILAETLANLMTGEEWVTDEMKLKFCVLFVENLIDNSIEASIDRTILEKIRKKTFSEGMKLMKRRPEMGMHYMIVIIMEELRHRQSFSEKEQFEFYDELLSCFFPKYKVSDFIINNMVQ